MFVDPSKRNVVTIPQPFLNSLILFKPEEIVISKQEAFDILTFFFFHPGIRIVDLTVDDLAFAQALLTEAIDSSYGYSFLAATNNQYMSDVIQKIAVNYLVKTKGQYNAAAVYESVLKRLKSKGIHPTVKKALYATYQIIWMVRVKAGVPATH